MVVKEEVLNKLNLACIEEYKRNNEFTDAWLKEHEFEYVDRIEAIMACPRLSSQNLEKFWNSFPKNEHNNVGQILLTVNI